MFGSDILEVALGMAFVYALLSLVVSAARESVETVLKARAKDLERGLGELLGDPNGANALQWLYDHPVIAGLYQGTREEAEAFAQKVLAAGSKLPTYIPSASFSAAILDLAARGKDAVIAATTGDAVTLAAIRQGIVTNFGENPQLQRALLVALDDAGDSLPKARANVEAWFDNGMDRVSGWYKRRTQYWLLAIGLVTAVALNVDSIRIVDALASNDTLRKAVVATAEANAKQPSTPPDFDAARRQVEALALPIGWTTYLDDADTARCDAKKDPVGCRASRPWVFQSGGLSLWWTAFWAGLGNGLMGWLLTALAVSFGAPFWFDVLNKIMVIRSTVKPGEKSGGDAVRGASKKN